MGSKVMCCVKDLTIISYKLNKFQPQKRRANTKLIKTSVIFLKAAKKKQIKRSSKHLGSLIKGELITILFKFSLKKT